MADVRLNRHEDMVSVLLCDIFLLLVIAIMSVINFMRATGVVVGVRVVYDPFDFEN